MSNAFHTRLPQPGAMPSMPRVNGHVLTAHSRAPPSGPTPSPRLASPVFLLSSSHALAVVSSPLDNGDVGIPIPGPSCHETCITHALGASQCPDLRLLPAPKPSDPTAYGQKPFLPSIPGSFMIPLLFPH